MLSVNFNIALSEFVCFLKVSRFALSLVIVVVASIECNKLPSASSMTILSVALQSETIKTDT